MSETRTRKLKSIADVRTGMKIICPLSKSREFTEVNGRTKFALTSSDTWFYVCDVCEKYHGPKGLNIIVGEA